METPFTVRKAALSDAKSIAQFNIAMAMETEQKVLEKDKIEQGVNALFDHPEYGFYMIAESGETIVGSLMITFEWSDWRNGLFWWIQSVYVVPEFRRRGVYRSMYQKIREMAARQDQVCGFRLYVERDNAGAQKTYRTLGMEETHYKMFEEMANA